MQHTEHRPENPVMRQKRVDVTSSATQRLADLEGVDSEAIELERALRDRDDRARGAS